ncbi:MAG: hypothetical protein K6F84_00290, partial [Lachnospiraceae bacterium]|nr:hypothetical protein [Lachnospiraceae bacterium]
MKKRLAVALMFAMTLGLFAGCGSKSGRGYTSVVEDRKMAANSAAYSYEGDYKDEAAEWGEDYYAEESYDEEAGDYNGDTSSSVD